MRIPTLIICLLTLFNAPISAARLQRVMVLETVNRTGDANLKYLEASISDAIRTELQNRFAFTQMPVEQRNVLAKSNFIFPQDFDTETAAVNLGLLARQDIVLTGSFERAAGGIVVQIRIIGVAEKKVLKTFSHKARVDGSIFNTIQAIAAESAVEMEKILPSKDDFSRVSLADGFYEGGLNQVLLAVGFAPALFSKGSALATGSELSPADLGNLIFRGAYRRNSVFRENLYLEGRAAMELGAQKFTVNQSELAGVQLPGKNLGFRLSIPAGIRFPLFGMILLQPYLGPAANFGTITIDASSSDIVVLDANKNPVTQLKKNYAGVGFTSGTDITFLLKSNIQIFTDIEYQMIFADGGNFATLGFYMGAGYRL